MIEVLYSTFGPYLYAYIVFNTWNTTRFISSHRATQQQPVQVRGSSNQQLGRSRVPTPRDEPTKVTKPFKESHATCTLKQFIVEFSKTIISLKLVMVFVTIFLMNVNFF